MIYKLIFGIKLLTNSVPAFKFISYISFKIFFSATKAIKLANYFVIQKKYTTFALTKQRGVEQW